MATEPLDKYVRIGDVFLTHWSQANDTLRPKALTLKGGYSIGDLQAGRDALAATLTDITDADNDVQGFRARRGVQQQDLKERLRQFRNAVLGQLGGTEPAAKLPLIPKVNATPEVWIKTLDDMASIWQGIETTPPEGFAGPLTLAESYDRTQFAAGLADLKATYTAIVQGEGKARLLRQSRTTQAAAIRARLVAYRKAVVGAFAAGHPLLATLPGL